MTALSRAEEALRVARRELEAASSEVPAYRLDDLRFLRGEVGMIRRRVEAVLEALGDMDPEPPGAA